jgi:hypothetical protein
LLSAIPWQTERGIYAASMVDCKRTLENFERSVYAIGEAA